MSHDRDRQSELDQSEERDPAIECKLVNSVITVIKNLLAQENFTRQLDAAEDADDRDKIELQQALIFSVHQPTE
jgi:hypothetical protein